MLETFSALLALCAGISPVIFEFPSHRPVTWSFDAFFDLRLNKWLSKQSRIWWLETPSPQLWRHCNESCFIALSQTTGTPVNHRLHIDPKCWLKEIRGLCYLGHLLRRKISSTNENRSWTWNYIIINAKGIISHAWLIWCWSLWVSNYIPQKPWTELLIHVIYLIWSGSTKWPCNVVLSWYTLKSIHLGPTMSTRAKPTTVALNIS